MSDLFTDAGAQFSGCLTYRYKLWRLWSDEPPVLFIMLNPSTADADRTDPTVERCVRYARAWGDGGLLVCNLFALRSTDPQELYKHIAPIGTRNDEAILAEAERASRIICAWGNHGRHLGRSYYLRRLLEDNGFDLWVLKLTSKGEPNHPLYLRRDLQPTAWIKPAEADIQNSGELEQ